MERKRKTIGVLIYVAREKEYEIVNVAVTPTYQGKGIGGKLLETAFQKLSQLASNQTRIIIRTGTTSSAALHLYQKWAMWRLVESKTILSIITLSPFLKMEIN